MKFSNLITGLAGVALAAVLSTAAFADGPAKHQGLYVWGGLGANWAEDSDVSGTGLSGDVGYDGTGWAGAAAVGWL